MVESSPIKEFLINLDETDETSESNTSPKNKSEESPKIDGNYEQEIGDIESNIDNDNGLERIMKEKSELQKKLDSLEIQLRHQRDELEREVQRRCELEQRFTEDAKRSSDQIEELISKSNQDDARILEFQKRVDYYAQETSSMIESFTTNREVLTSQLQQLRYENDFLLGKFLSKSRDLQNESINLPQTVDELQFYCLKLTEKLILSTLAKERLEETLIQGSRT